MAITVDDVRLIFETPMSDPQLDAFMQSAVRFVDAELSAAGLTSETLDDIAKYLTAHFASTVTPFTDRERIGRDYEYFRTGSFGEGLKSTMYGQIVLTLDTSGTLQAVGKKQKITFRVLTTPEVQ